MLIRSIEALTVCSTAILIGRLYITLLIPRIICKTKTSSAIMLISLIVVFDCLKNIYANRYKYNAVNNSAPKRCVK